MGVVIKCECDGQGDIVEQKYLLMSCRKFECTNMQGSKNVWLSDIFTVLNLSPGCGHRT